MLPVYSKQRLHARRNYKECVEICLNSRPHRETLLAITSNISDAGAGIYTFKPLREGEKVLFKSILSMPSREATVRWVDQRSQNMYRAGVMFIDGQGSNQLSEAGSS